MGMEEPSHTFDLADEQRDQNHPHQRSVIPRDRMRNRPIDRERYGEDSYQQCCDIQGEEPIRELVACLTQRRVCHSRRLPLGNSPDHFGPLRTVVTRPTAVQGIWTAIRLQPGPQDLCTPKLTRDPSAPARRTRPLIMHSATQRRDVVPTIRQGRPPNGQVTVVQRHEVSSLWSRGPSSSSANAVISLGILIHE